MDKWDGKTKGSLWGYKFFIFCIRTFGLNISYFFCYIVSAYYVWFMPKQRDGLIRFYQVGFGFTKKQARKITYKTFYNFGQTLIDRIAMLTKKKKSFTHTFNNEKVLRELHENQKGAILISGHVGNWENAGNLIHQRITSTINIVMMDAEVEKVKAFLELKTGGSKYNLIPIRDDLSHLILMHKALKRNEFIAIHADRALAKGKNFEMDFLGGKAKFPAGPFILAKKFKVPITFVYAVKGSKFHYDLFATDPITEADSEETIAQAYVSHLETMVQKYPAQWFNFYDYYVN
ncbi:MAG: lysophospholipid acyltransferase family protein [Crocinitomicaceae bacterium]|nr:lysophospholipid acyltransferase family protein [Crocinitomicaceae bacterium]